MGRRWLRMATGKTVNTGYRTAPKPFSDYSETSPVGMLGVECFPSVCLYVIYHGS